MLTNKHKMEKMKTCSKVQVYETWYFTQHDLSNMITQTLYKSSGKLITKVGGHVYLIFVPCPYGTILKHIICPPSAISLTLMLALHRYHKNITIAKIFEQLIQDFLS
uniref:Uncharacterized protein n=1 Tax=Arion vulgaris TaxID=1028688 RepID=A0A0B7B6R5_9EUPU